MGTTASVVICAYTTDRWKQLQAAVQSVLDQDPRPEQVLVVVDHCQDLLLRAENAFGGSVAVLPNAHRKGLSGARNTGTAQATGDVVVFLDDDAVAQPGWLAGHLKQFDDPDVLGVGGLVVPWWETAKPRWFPDEFGWVVGCSYRGQPTVTAAVRNPIGANMSFRRHVIDEVGGFSESLGRVGTLPEGCEETELAIRAAAAHPEGRILHAPVAAVRHHVPASRGTWSYFRRRCWAEGLSKARVSRMASSPGALQSERAYVRSVLPSGVGRNLLQAASQRDVAHLLTATAICAGLAVTAGGFATGRLVSAVPEAPRRAYLGRT